MKKTKKRDYMIRRPNGRKIDYTSKITAEQLTGRELDELFGGELCQTDSDLKY